MVVGIQSSFLEATRLRGCKHAQRAAYFHPQRINTFHHLDDFVEVAVVANFSPRSAHTKTSAACLFGFGCPRKDFIYIKKSVHLDIGVISRSLWTITTVLRTTARLDRQERAHLHFRGIMIPAMYRSRAVDQFHYRHVV